MDPSPNMSFEPSLYHPARLSKVIQRPAFTSLILHTPIKEIALFVDPSVGTQIQNLLLQNSARRPSTHDLMEKLLEGHSIQVHRVLIYDVVDNIFKARLITEQGRAGSLAIVCDIDCRPSDAIMIALRQEAPLFVSMEVLQKAPESLEEV